MLLLLLLAACPSPEPEPEPTPTPSDAVLEETPLPDCEIGEPGFDPMPQTWNLDFVSEAPANEEVGGIALADLDGDGRTDLVAPQRSGAVSVFWNEGASFGRADFEFDGDIFGLSVADYDGDRRLDLFLTGPTTAALYRNDGQRVFVEDPVGIDIGDGWGAGGVWGDHDGDGDLDLYVLRQMDLEDEHDDDDFADDDDHADDDDQTDEGPFFEGAGNELWRNDGDLFSRLTLAPTQTPGLTHHARWHDFDGDHDLDLLVLNDGGNFGNNSELWEHDGSAWVERGLDGFGILENPMGALVQDLDGDGFVDLWISDIGKTRLFRGGINWSFVDVGLTDIDPAEHNPSDVSWSLIPLDVDGDGTDEVFVTYGGLFEPTTNGEPSVQDQPNRIYRWQEGRYVSDPSLLPPSARNARGAARGDLNGDGWPDLAVRNIDGPLTVLLSRCPSQKRVKVRLDDSTGRNRFGIGATVTVDGQTEAVQAGGLGTYSGSGPELYFGTGDAETVSLSVTWPDGRTDTFPTACASCDLRVRR